jgi:hypothetical protein
MPNPRKSPAAAGDLGFEEAPPVTQLAQAVEEQCASKGIASLTLVQAGMGAPSNQARHRE